MSLTLRQALANDVVASFANPGAVNVVQNILKYADRLQRSNNNQVCADLCAYARASTPLLVRHQVAGKVLAWLHTAHEDYIPSAVRRWSNVDEAEAGRLLTVISLALKTIENC